MNNDVERPDSRVCGYYLIRGFCDGGVVDDFLLGLLLGLTSFESVGGGSGLSCSNVNVAAELALSLAESLESLGGGSGLSFSNVDEAAELALSLAESLDLDLPSAAQGFLSASLDLNERAGVSSEALSRSDSVDIVTGIPTTITNGNEGMISSRFQDHSWVTEDGVVHVMANTNGQLSLYSSDDSGLTWEETATLENSSGSSRADGLIVDGKLYEVYTMGNGGVALSILSYSEDDVSWTIDSTSVYPSPSSIRLDRPSITVAENGTIVVACTATDRATGQASLRIGYSQDQGSKWANVDLGIVNTSGDGQMSGDIIATDDGVGLLYTNGNTLNWIDYSKAGANGSKLESELILVKGDTQKDPNGTHFSSVTDADGNIHVATNNGENRVVYLRYVNKTDTWDDPVEITTYRSGNYMQISILDDGSIHILYDVNARGEKFLEVSESVDGGDSWTVEARLTQDIVENPGNARMETPAYAQDNLPVFQQVELTNGSNSLVYYEVV